MQGDKIDKVKLFISSNKVRMDINRRMGPSKELPYVEDSLESRTLYLLVQMLEDRRLRGADEVNLVGEWLYRVLLENTVGDELNNKIADLSTFLRIELAFEESNGPWAKLPWEYLRRPTKKDHQVESKPYFLSTHDQIALLRVPNANCGTLSVAEKEPRILIVASSPTDLPRLLFEDLTKKITANVKSLKAKVRVLATPYTKNPEVDGIEAERLKGLENFDGPATFDNFENALKFSPHVVHFLGHGKTEEGVGKIAFAEDNCRADWKSGEQIAKKLALQRSVKLVFLQACESAKEARTKKYKPAWSDAYQALSSVAGQVVQTARIPAIVAMQAKVTNIAANDFACAFYEALAKREPVYRALQSARKAYKGSPEFMPVLYLDTGGDNDAGVLFPALDPDGDRDGGQNSTTKRSNSPNNITCPWCRKFMSVAAGTAAVDMRHCSNVECRSYLRCSSCGREIGNVENNEEAIACTGCSAIIKRGPPEAEPASVAAAGPAVDEGRTQEQHQGDVFFGPRKRVADTGGDGSNVR